MAVADLSKVLWLRAKDLTGADGADVTSWADASGSGHNATSVGLAPKIAAGATPSGGKAVKFAKNGRIDPSVSGHFDLGNLGLSGDGEAWIVVKGPSRAGQDPQTGSPGLWAFNTRSADGNIFPYWVQGDFSIYESFGSTGRTNDISSGVPLDQWRVYRVQKTTGQLRIWVDNTLRGLSPYARTTAWPTSYLLGRSLAGASAYDTAFGGWVAELIVRPVASTTAEATDIWNYLQAEHFQPPPVGGVTGSVSATAPKAAVAVAGAVVAGPVSGQVAAVAAPASVAASGATAGGSTSGQVGAVAVPATVTISGDVPRPPAHLEPWTADLSQRTRLVLVASGTVEAMPTLEEPPTGFTERPLMRQSLAVPALTSLADIVGGQAVSAPDYAALEDAATVEEMGVPHVVIGGHDVTYFRGVPAQIGSFRSEEPFGDLSATVVFPQITSMDDEPDDSNVHPFNWSRIRANVQFILRRPGGTKTRLWSGHVVSHDVSDGGLTLTCQGSLWQASADVHKVPTMLDPTDIGTLITKALNGVASRRYPRLPAPRTGIMSRQRGSWSDSPLAYVQGLLATAWTSSGRQWTVAKVPNTWRTYEMRLKKTAPQWTVTNGARGVQVDLSLDGTTMRNVIYGHGVGPDGYAWWNYHYPGMKRDDAPLWPGVLMGLGATDASSNGGVSLWQARVKDLGYRIDVDGQISASDVTIIRAVQRKYGLQVDDVIGPQTWAATFDVGANGGDLSNVIRLPLAADPRTQKWLYTADGSIAGENPEYDKNHLIYADDVDFGSGITRGQGIESAQQIVDREANPGWSGRITLRVDPREGSRFLIAAGDKITIVGFRGADRVLHVTAAEYDLQGLTVTLDVDEKSRDAMTLAQIRDRNKEARRDPARRPGNVNRRSRLDVDQVIPFDGESGAGWIPKFAVYGGLWSVIRVPVSELGRVARIWLQTTGPISPFAVALFGAPITPAHLVKNVGNPLAKSSPYEAKMALLEDRFGFIEAWGEQNEAAGYSPGSQANKSPLTGRLDEVGGFEYVSAKPPWIWVAVYSPNTTYVSGRILPAPIQ